MPSKKPGGMPAFCLVWLGQLVALLGIGMTGFSLTIWAYELTGSATALALVGFFNVIPLRVINHAT